MITSLDWFMVLFSNFIFLALIPWMLYVARRRTDLKPSHWLFECSFCLQLAIFSCFNHLCSNSNIGICIGENSAQFLLNLDIVNSLLVVSSSVSLFLHGLPRDIFLPGIYPITYILILSLGDNYIAMVIVFGIDFTVLMYTRFWPLFFETRRHWSVLASFLGFGLAFTFKIWSDSYYPMSIDNQDGIQKYDLYHSLWHIFAGISSMLLIWDARYDCSKMRLSGIVDI